MWLRHSGLQTLVALSDHIFVVTDSGDEKSLSPRPQLTPLVSMAPSLASTLDPPTTTSSLPTIEEAATLDDQQPDDRPRKRKTGSSKVSIQFPNLIHTLC